MRKKSFLNNITAAFLGIILGFAIEGAAVYVFVKNNIQAVDPVFFSFLLLHVAAVVVFSFGMYRGAIEYHFDSPLNWLIISVAMCLIFSMAGVVSITVMFMLLARRSWKKVDIYDDYMHYITYDYSPEKRHIDADKLVETIDEELEVSPLVDVLTEADVRLRRGAIGIMQRLPRKDAVRLLKLSLQDQNVEIRFHAALGLSAIEAELNNNIVMAKKEVDRNPTSPDSHISLANSYAEYHESGILDYITSVHYRDLAINEYYKILDLGAEETNVLNSIGNLELQRGNYDVAQAKFKRACEIEPYNVYANVGLIQVLYETGHIDKAIHLASTIIDKIPPTKGPMRAIIEYWSS